jgi:hypothetical protein
VLARNGRAILAGYRLPQLDNNSADVLAEVVYERANDHRERNAIMLSAAAAAARLKCGESDGDVRFPRSQACSKESSSGGI